MCASGTCELPEEAESACRRAFPLSRPPHCHSEMPFPVGIACNSGLLGQRQFGQYMQKAAYYTILPHEYRRFYSRRNGLKSNHHGTLRIEYVECTV
jgi:hypothetical protein